MKEEGYKTGIYIVHGRCSYVRDIGKKWMRKSKYMKKKYSNWIIWKRLT